MIMQHEITTFKVGLIAYLLMRCDSQPDVLTKVGRKGDAFIFRSTKSLKEWQTEYNQSDERKHDQLVCKVRDEIRLGRKVNSGPSMDQMSAL